VTAEQVRRSGNPAAAVDLCRDALARFPGHLSARVTLGWALLDLGRLKEAREEFQIVRQHAPDNFAAIRGLAQLHVLEENDPSYTPDMDAGHEPAAPAAAAVPAAAVPPAVEPPATISTAAPAPPPVVPIVELVAERLAEPPVQQPPPAAPAHIEAVSPSPVVMRLETWLSRVAALKAAV